MLASVLSGRTAFAATKRLITSSAALPPSHLTAPSLDPEEAAKFAALSEQWWAVDGPFAPLHNFNTPRIKFIRDSVSAAHHLAWSLPEPFAGLKVLDVGCGGGILSEPLARLGANVLGIDVTGENVGAATAHSKGDPLLSTRLRYQAVPAEQLSAEGLKFDLVVASEVIEHVRQPQEFLKTLASLAKEDGRVVVSTLSRTMQSLTLAVVAAEYVMRMVPPGTHDWARFITPEELAIMGRKSGLKMEYLSGITYEKLSGRFSLGDDVGINYIAMFKPLVKADQEADRE